MFCCGNDSRYFQTDTHILVVYIFTESITFTKHIECKVFTYAKHTTCARVVSQCIHAQKEVGGEGKGGRTHTQIYLHAQNMQAKRKIFPNEMIARNSSPSSSWSWLVFVFYVTYERARHLHSHVSDALRYSECREKCQIRKVLSGTRASVRRSERAVIPQDGGQEGGKKCLRSANKLIFK